MSISSRLCEKCQQPFKGEKPFYNANDVRGVPPRYKYHQSWQDLTTAAQDGCYICAWYIKLYPEPLEFSEGAEISFHIREGKSGEESSINVDHFPGGDLSMDVKSTSAISQHVGDWIPPSRFTADGLRALIPRWMTRCKRDHRKCTSVLYCYAPTRLLRISQEESSTYVKLVKGEDVPLVQYCTVSHCWGDESLPKLLDSNFLALQQGIDVDKLPKSYRDAIWVSRSLEIDYIWIDSLCIMQDSVQDWRHEAGTMCHVYQGAEFNIALTAASDGRDSCLAGRDSSLIRPISVRATWVNEPGLDFTILPPARWWYEELTASKLVHRSWILQEIQLAARVIIIGRDQIWQTCLEDIFCETLRGGSDGGHDFYGDHYFAKRRPYSHEEWERMVEVYSRCGLTVPSDKATAIGGLAQQYAQTLRDEYYAGMCMSRLPIQLLWRSSSFRGKRTTIYRAPTWSWLSMEGTVKFNSDDGGSTSTMCDIQRIGVDLEDPNNPWGGISGGFVVIYGHIATATLWNDEKVTLFDHKARRETTIEDKRLDDPDCDQDLWFHCTGDELHWEEQTYDSSLNRLEVQDMDEHYAVEPPETYMLPICWENRSGECQGLILQRVQNSESFERRGTFMVSKQLATNYLLNTERRGVRII